MDGSILQKEIKDLYLEPHTLYNIWGSQGSQQKLLYFDKTEADEKRNNARIKAGEIEFFSRITINTITIDSDILPARDDTMFIDVEKKEAYDEEQKKKVKKTIKANLKF